MNEQRTPSKPPRERHVTPPGEESVASGSRAVSDDQPLPLEQALEQMIQSGAIYLPEDGSVPPTIGTAQAAVQGEPHKPGATVPLREESSPALSESMDEPLSPAARRRKSRTYPTPETGDWLVQEPLGRRRHMLTPPLGHAALLGEESHVIGGRYQIVESLAMGGMGAVFQVNHLDLGKTFALKIIHAGQSSDTQMQRYFFREARLLSSLSHPNIVQVTDFGTDDRFGSYLVMEHLEGESLHTRLVREKRLGVAQALQIGLQVAEALHYMHERDLIHCDIKAENILLCRQPSGKRQRTVAKLIDFGLSRSLKGHVSDEHEVGGTPIYAAPEQIAGEAPRTSMDIYAVGVLLYEMLVGEAPFVGTPVEVCRIKLEAPAPPIDKRVDDPPDDQLQTVIMRALETLAENRQPSMSQLVFELRTVREMLGFSERTSRRSWRQVRREKKLAKAKEKDRSRARARKQVEKFWATCPVPMFQLDRDGELEFASPAFCRMVGQSSDDIQGRLLSATRMGNIYPEVDSEVASSAESGQALRRKMSYQTDDGRWASVLLWIVPQLDRKGWTTHLWGVAMPEWPSDEGE